MPDQCNYDLLLKRIEDVLTPRYIKRHFSECAHFTDQVIILARENLLSEGLSFVGQIAFSSAYDLQSNSSFGSKQVSFLEKFLGSMGFELGQFKDKDQPDNPSEKRQRDIQILILSQIVHDYKAQEAPLIVQSNNHSIHFTVTPDSLNALTRKFEYTARGLQQTVNDPAYQNAVLALLIQHHEARQKNPALGDEDTLGYIERRSAGL